MEDLALVRDESAERVSQSRREHIPIEGNEGQVQAVEPEVAEGEQGAKMVTRRKLTANRCLSDPQSSAQP